MASAQLVNAILAVEQQSLPKRRASLGMCFFATITPNVMPYLPVVVVNGIQFINMTVGYYESKIEYMKVLRRTETFNALKAIDILSKAPVRIISASGDC
jgi:hypothetical protein